MIDRRRGRVGPRNPSVPVAGWGGTSHTGAPHARSLSAGSLLAAAVLASLVACSAPVHPGGTPATPGSGIPIGASASTTDSGPKATGSTTGSRIALKGTVFSSPGCPGPAQAESPCPDHVSRTSEPISVTGPVNVALVVDSGMR